MNIEQERLHRDRQRYKQMLDSLQDWKQRTKSKREKMRRIETNSTTANLKPKTQQNHKQSLIDMERSIKYKSYFGRNAIRQVNQDIKFIKTGIKSLN